MTTHVCGAICGEALEEVVRRPHGEPRHCYGCRAKRPFTYVVLTPVEISWYGPSRSIQCAFCGLVDGDLFPGRYREWEE